MVARSVSCGGAAPCTENWLSSMAVRESISEVLDCSMERNGAGIPMEGSAHVRSHSSGAESRFLRAMSPEGNHEAEQQRQLLQQQLQRAANHGGSAVLPCGRVGRARNTSFHHLEGNSNTAACGSPMFHECAAVLDLQSASVTGPWCLSNSVASPGASLAQVMALTSPDSARHNQLSRGNCTNRTNIPNLPLQQLQQQQQHISTMQSAAASSMLGAGGLRQHRHGYCSPRIPQSPSPVESMYSGVDSTMQQGAPQRFPSPRVMSMSLSPRQHGQQLV